MSRVTSGTDGQRTIEGDTLADACYPLYTRLFGETGSFVTSVEQKLAASRTSTTVELYLSRALGVGILSGLLLWVSGTVLAYALFVTGVVEVGPLFGARIRDETLLTLIQTVREPFLVALAGIVFGFVGFMGGFGTLVAVPYVRSSSRRREVNMLLADAVSFMYALSVGGMNQLEILEAVARAEDTYGEVSREFQSIVQETEYFDTDYRTAIRNQAMETPSEDLSQFLIDMLSIIDSGGNMSKFLEEKKHHYVQTAKQEQERTLQTLELFAEMYITLSLFPLLLIIILVIMNMIGNSQTILLFLTVYGLIPLTGIGFLVLVATVKQDDLGDGVIQLDDRRDRQENAQHMMGGGTDHPGALADEYYVFDRIKNREMTYAVGQLLKQPHYVFRDHPMYTLAVTVPLTALLLGIAVYVGEAPTSWGQLTAEPVWGTFLFVYLPAFVICIPLAVFHEWNIRSRRAILDGLSGNLRKLASVNDTGMTLLEATGTVAKTSSDKLADEFGTVYRKVNYGMSIKESLVEFNNAYRLPRLARTIKLISKAQEASNRITEVLSTAAQASENQDEIDRERRSRTLMQVAIILMSYVTLLGVMAILKVQFIDVLAGLTEQAQGAGGGGQEAGLNTNVDTSLLSMMFFHAVTLQAFLSGLASGYLRDANVMSGVKYVVVLLVIALVVWMGVS